MYEDVTNLTGICSIHVRLSREGAHTALGVVTGCAEVKLAGWAWSRHQDLPQGPGPRRTGWDRV